LDACRRIHARGGEARALGGLAELAARGKTPDFQKAQSFCREALHLGDEPGKRPLAPPRPPPPGKLYPRPGKSAPARQHLATATTMYREMGMTYWLEQAEAQIREPM